MECGKLADQDCRFAIGMNTFFQGTIKTTIPWDDPILDTIVLVLEVASDEGQLDQEGLRGCGAVVCQARSAEHNCKFRFIYII